MPTDNLIGDAQLQLIIGQVSPFNTGQAGGTGLQNYSGEIVFGLTDTLQLSGFYTQADAPLYAPKGSRQNQPENRWNSAGAALHWKFAQSGPVSFGLEGALESFTVKSGGTNSVGSTSTSCNIFNSNCSTAVETNNLVGSISAPISWQANQQLQFNLTPGVTFLPANQGQQQWQRPVLWHHYLFRRWGELPANQQGAVLCFGLGAPWPWQQQLQQ